MLKERESVTCLLARADSVLTTKSLTLLRAEASWKPRFIYGACFKGIRPEFHVNAILLDFLHELREVQLARAGEIEEEEEAEEESHEHGDWSVGKDQKRNGVILR